MWRRIEEKLKHWKEDPYRKPLLVRGVRQVGKSYLVEKFANKYFPGRFLKFDFEARPELKKIFTENLEPHTILPRLETLANQIIDKNETLIFFDEVQACPEAITALRYFYEQQPKLPVIAAGSLLEFALSKISIPVGRVNLLNVYPMTFVEFLVAGNKTRIVELLSSGPAKLSEAEHMFILGEYVNYLSVGGLPEAVKRYTGTGSIQQALFVQKELVQLYEADFSKYSGRASIECLGQVLHSTPRFITKAVKFSHLSSDFSVPTIKNSLKLLGLAQIVKKVPTVNPHGLPLGGSTSFKTFKLLLADLGLMHGLSGFNADLPANSSKILDSYRGALAEQAVGQSLCEQFDGEIFSWSRPATGSQAEVDFVLAKGGSVYPIEVKSGAPGRLKSMHIFLKEYPLAKTGYVISTAPFKEIPKNRLVLVPIYFTDHLSDWL